ncbi:MAG: DUF1015 domain-containing protein [bacterium]|nr:DUF1015 domain-containing protein [bacterium]
MTVARPLRALRYDTDRVDLSRVIVPPYDVIADDERGDFFDRDPHNAIRFELTRDANDEAAADYGWIRETLDAWRAEGVLVRDDTPAYYVMGQRYEAPDGQRLERIGFFAELGLAEYDERVVRPHERTLAGPRADRLKLLRAAEANLSTVFLLYEDREDTLGSLLAEALERGDVARAAFGEVEYRLARLDDPAAIAQVRAFMDARPSVIADGHHRYETALEYRRQQTLAHGDDPDAPWQSTIAYFANAWAKGSLLLPIHRVVREVAAPSEAEWRAKLPDWTIRALAPVDLEGVEARLAAELAPLAGRPAFVAESAGGAALLVSRDEPLGDELMVRLLERDVLGTVFGLDAEAIRGGAVAFPKSARRAGQEIREGKGTVALYLNALTPDDVFRVTEAGEVMPQKSTFFHPKIPTGMVFRDHRADPSSDAAGAV